MKPPSKPWVVAVGASGGQGLDDLTELLGALPSSLAAIVMIVLHRPWGRPSELRSVLARASRLPVIVAAQGERFEVGNAYIGEPAEHLTLAARSLDKLVIDPKQRYRNRTVDLLFRSVATHGGSRVIGVILSGSLDDGSRGLASIHKAGGITMVLTPATPPQHGMPESAIQFDGRIDLVGNPHRIARGICALVQNGRDAARSLEPA
jgi:two-component system, chemotaxis family, protein-glutamate methylesterase/glutaminase